jgi:hypothetical protein
MPQPLYPARERDPSNHWIGGWVDPRAGLYDVEKRTFLTLPVRELQPLGHPAPSQSFNYATSTVVVTTWDFSLSCLISRTLLKLQSMKSCDLEICWFSCPLLEGNFHMTYCYSSAVGPNFKDR